MGNNTLYIAAAGAGKTTFLVDRALRFASEKVLITTYTDENTAVIKSEIRKRRGGIPNNIEVIPWFTFLLRYGVKPFLASTGFGDKDPQGVNLVNGRSAPYARKTSPAYYFDNDEKVYNDKLAALALLENERTNGLVIRRISLVYDVILIDEIQDVSGPDLDFIGCLLKSECDVIMAGDQRQHTFSTNNAARNSQFRSLGLGSYLESSGLVGLCKVDQETLNGSYRCSQPILDFANTLYPDFPETVSLQRSSHQDGSHLGVYLIQRNAVMEYAARWSPAPLRFDARSFVTDGISATNCGVSKGRTFDRVLFFPSGTILDWMKGKRDDLSGTTRAKLYVAVTRARFSVAIVVDQSFECHRSGVVSLP